MIKSSYNPEYMNYFVKKIQKKKSIKILNMINNFLNAKY